MNNGPFILESSSSLVKGSKQNSGFSYARVNEDDLCSFEFVFLLLS